MTNKRNKLRMLRHECLEPRVLLTTTIYLDFGLGFDPVEVDKNGEPVAIPLRMADGTLPTRDDLRNFTGKTRWGTGTAIGGSPRNPIEIESMYFGDLNGGDVNVLGEKVRDAAARILAPFDVSVQKVTAQNWEEAQSILQSNPDESDAYVFVADIWQTGLTGRRLQANTVDGGLAASEDLENQIGNLLDEAAVVFGENIWALIEPMGDSEDVAYEKLWTMLANTAVHEAFHTFSFVHSGSPDNQSSTNPDEILARADIVSAGELGREGFISPKMITRHPSLSHDLIGGEEVPEPNNNNYWLAETLFGLKDESPNNGTDDYEFITGTGYNDTITVTFGSGNLVSVNIDNNFPGGNPTYSNLNYTTDFDGKLIIEGGFGNDVIRVNGLLDGQIELYFRGNDGDDTLIMTDLSMTAGGSIPYLRFDGDGGEDRTIGLEHASFADLRGGMGDDDLNGSDGADTIDGGSGNDRVDGGSGTDTYIINGDDEVTDELINDGSGLGGVNTMIFEAGRHTVDYTYLLPNIASSLTFTHVTNGAQVETTPMLALVIDAMFAATSDGTFDEQWDFVDDGELVHEPMSANSDTAEFIENIAGTRFGDADLDGDVDINDFQTVIGNWTKAGDSWLDGDFNGDGIVNADDFNFIGVNWQYGV